MRYRVTYWVLARSPCENKRRSMSSGVATHRWPHCKPSSLKFSGMWSNRCHSLYSRCRPSSTSVNEKNPTLTLLGTRGRYSGKGLEVGDGVDVVRFADTWHLDHEVGMVPHEGAGTLVTSGRQQRPHRTSQTDGVAATAAI